jgi:beta-lysine 5,6-aminomutase alpha subunit
VALRGVRYVLNAAGNLGEDFHPAPDGFIVRRAHHVLDEAVALLGRVVDAGLLSAIADGTFGLMKRPADGGRGADGVVAKADDYLNPVTEALDGLAAAELPTSAGVGN